MANDSIFVYGTLRRGGVRDMRVLFPDSAFVSKAVARGALYDFGEYPGLVLDDEGDAVTGEVYTISGEILKKLDEIEGFDESDSEANYYLRRRIRVTLESGSPRDCWIYVCNPKKFDLVTRIPSGDWIEHAPSKTVSTPDRLPDEEPSL
jgi:gamma-glutamylcyclotransferase (GGCT)/AIG2-like uncharacterized protein YtfP